MTSYTNSSKSTTNRDCGFGRFFGGGGWGGGGGILAVNIIKRIGQKLRRIILLQFGLVNFRFHFRKTPKVIIFMFFSDLADVSMAPKTNLIYFWRH